jgi:hypothetical protein
MTNDSNLDAIRTGVLHRMERHARYVRLGIAAGALLELLLFAIAAMQLQFSNRFEVLVFAFFVLTYSIIVLGMFVLAAHISRVGDRVLAALAERGRP